jgi:CheY-like chemotaxis protein
LILLDLMMRGKNGWQFRAEQLQDPRLALIPVLSVSGDGRVREKALALGLSESLPKPIDFEKLLAVIGHHCHSSS